MSKERFIPVFIDWKPQENLDPSVEEYRCLVGLLASRMDGVAGLKAYKKTRKKRKLKAANKIIECLAQETIEVDAIGVAGKTNGQFMHWAIDTINRARKLIGAEWELDGTTPTKLKWNGYVFPRSNVLGLCMYSGMLPIIGLRSEILAHKSTENVKKIKLCLDALPHNPIEGIQLMEALRGEPEIAEMWKNNRERGFSFQFGILESFEDDKGNTVPGKEHPNMILVDWLAAGCLAKVNPEQLQIEGGYNDAEVEEIGEIWETARKQARGSANIIDVDDPEYRRKVTEYWQAKK